MPKGKQLLETNCPERRRRIKGMPPIDLQVLIFVELQCLNQCIDAKKKFPFAHAWILGKHL
jgi:hypothetical protein